MDEIKTTPNGLPAAKQDSNQGKNTVKPAEPLPGSARPRKDGPGGD